MGQHEGAGDASVQCFNKVKYDKRIAENSAIFVC